MLRHLSAGLAALLLVSGCTGSDGTGGDGSSPGAAPSPEGTNMASPQDSPDVTASQGPSEGLTSPGPSGWSDAPTPGQDWVRTVGTNGIALTHPPDWVVRVDDDDLLEIAAGEEPGQPLVQTRLMAAPAEVVDMRQLMRPIWQVLNMSSDNLTPFDQAPTVPMEAVDAADTIAMQFEYDAAMPDDTTVAVVEVSALVSYGLQGLRVRAIGNADQWETHGPQMAAIARSVELVGS